MLVVRVFKKMLKIKSVGKVLKNIPQDNKVSVQPNSLYANQEQAKMVLVFSMKCKCK